MQRTTSPNLLKVFFFEDEQTFHLLDNILRQDSNIFATRKMQ